MKWSINVQFYPMMQNDTLEILPAEFYPPASCSRERLTDRRENHRLAAFQSWFRKRRKTPRRNADENVSRYVDVHETWLMLLCLYIISLSTLDAFFTLNLLQNGSKELNPFMDYLIRQDHQLFLCVKYFISAISLVTLVMLKNFKLFGYISGYHILFGYAAAYSLLISYELSMLTRLPAY